MGNGRETLAVETIDQQSDDLAALSNRPISGHDTQAPAPVHAHTVHLHGFDSNGQPLVSGVPGLPGVMVTARSTVALPEASIGAEVVVLFDQGDVQRPIIIGVVQDQRRPDSAVVANKPGVSITVDDERLVLCADREIELSCGAAKITLTKAGKIIIHGTYVSSRSTGVNRIKGGSVQIN